jgi:dTDP-4-dehydrorhamnose 3,5-epimerase
MNFIKTKLDGVYIIEQNIFNDERGSFIKTFQESEFKKRNLECDFKESYYTNSNKNVIRGMHFQIPDKEHSKLITIIHGEIMDVILDLRKSSLTFGHHIKVKLSKENGKSIYVPKGCAHGFKVLSSSALTYYMVTTEHAPLYDSGIKLDSFGCNWGAGNSIISERDKNLVSFENFINPF